MIRTWGVKDEVRRTEWPQKRSSQVVQNMRLPAEVEGGVLQGIGPGSGSQLEMAYTRWGVFPTEVF